MKYHFISYEKSKDMKNLTKGADYYSFIFDNIVAKEIHLSDKTIKALSNLQLAMGIQNYKIIKIILCSHYNYCNILQKNKDFEEDKYIFFLNKTKNTAKASNTILQNPKYKKLYVDNIKILANEFLYEIAKIQSKQKPKKHHSTKDFDNSRCKLS